MPVTVPSLAGVDPKVERTLNSLVAAVNSLETIVARIERQLTSRATAPTSSPAAADDITFLRAQIQNLRDRVYALENP